MGDEQESDVLRDVRMLAGQMHPAELVVCVVRGHGWGTDPGGVDYIDSDGGGRAGTGGHGEVELYFDDSADTTRRVSRADYLDRKSTRLNSSHIQKSRMPSSA